MHKIYKKKTKTMKKIVKKVLKFECTNEKIGKTAWSVKDREFTERK